MRAPTLPALSPVRFFDSFFHSLSLSLSLLFRFMHPASSFRERYIASRNLHVPSFISQNGIPSKKERAGSSLEKRQKILADEVDDSLWYARRERSGTPPRSAPYIATVQNINYIYRGHACSKPTRLTSKPTGICTKTKIQHAVTFFFYHFIVSCNSARIHEEHNRECWGTKLRKKW